MPLGAPGRQTWILAVEGRDRGVTVDANHGRLLRRIQVHADHVGRLRFEARLVGGQVGIEAMRLDPVLGPKVRHCHVREGSAQSGHELARRPLCRSVGRFALGHPSQHRRLHPPGHLVALAPGVVCEQSRESFDRQAPAPAIE